MVRRTVAMDRLTMKMVDGIWRSDRRVTFFGKEQSGSGSRSKLRA